MKKFFSFIDRRCIAFFYDAIAACAAWFCAYYIFYPIFSTLAIIDLLPILISIQIIFFIFFGLYRSVWRFASLPDLVQIVKAVSCGTFFSLVYFHIEHAEITKSVPLLYGVFSMIFLGLGRLSVRWIKDRGNYFFHHDYQRVLIVGAGDAAESLIREMLRDTHHQYQPVAIVDSDLTKLNREIHRIRVVGSFAQIKSLVEKYKIEMIFIALSDASSKQMQIILQKCDSSLVPYRTIASFKEMASGQLLSSMRAVKVEDLLGRETYHVDSNLFHDALFNKRVLITGGGGSIGSELCRQVANLNPKVLFIVDHCESNLYKIELELHEHFPTLPVKIILLDILQQDLFELFFKTHQPQIVFHAAAYKQVPMLEKQLLIAVRNNVIGTKTVVDLAVRYNAEIFVQVSTDKAVNPTSVMGMTKRIAEIYCQHVNRSVKTKIITVRFGNVLGSAGSVVPLFTEQLQRGGPLTVTHPDITRYFMTIPEASRLILQAMVMGQGGEIFVLDMGEPIRIRELAEQMIRLSGKRAHQDIKIVYTGLRPGEKLQEELFYEKESMAKTCHKKVFRVEACQFDFSFIQSYLDDIVRYCALQDEPRLSKRCAQLVPEYRGEIKVMQKDVVMA